MMKRTKRFLQLLLAVAMLPTLSSVAQSESVVALSGNAYVTAPSKGNVFIDEGNCAITENGIDVLLQQTLHDGLCCADLQNTFLLCAVRR